MVRDVPYTGDRRIDVVGAILNVAGMGGIVLSILVWQEGGEAVLALLVVGGVALVGLGWWLIRQKRSGRSPCSTRTSSAPRTSRLGISEQMLQQIALGGLMIVLPIFLQMVLEYNAPGGPLDRPALPLTMFVVALLAGRRARESLATEHRHFGPATCSWRPGLRSSSRSSRGSTPVGGW